MSNHQFASVTAAHNLSNAAEPVLKVRDGPELRVPEGGARPARPRDRLLTWPVVLSTVILGAALLPIAPLRDAETLADVDNVRLVTAPAYLAVAPLYDVLDTLTLFSVRQHAAVLAFVLTLYLIWRLRVIVRRPHRSRRLGAECLLLVAVLVGIAGLYTFGTLAPRPMAALAVADPDVILVDFHSHTNLSHDGRESFDIVENRRWHRAAGFNAAYVTDHKTVAAALAGESANAATAGEDVVLLRGIEYVHRGAYVNALGDPAITIADSIRARAAHTAYHSSSADRQVPVLIQTIPEDLMFVPTPDAEGRGGVMAIELSDGAPRAIGQVHRERALILRIADSLDLAVVAGSNNHGWGRTAVAWSLLRIPRWRTVPSDSLSLLIEETIRTRRRQAVRVVERRGVDPGGSTASLALTAPVAAWQMFASLSPAQRVSWLVWVWALALAPRALPRRPRAWLRLMRRHARLAKRRATPKLPADATGRRS